MTRDDIAAVLLKAPFAWVEIANAGNKEPDGAWALGRKLWSPVVGDGGGDRYGIMRRPQAGDLVLHFVKGGGLVERAFAGLSWVREAARETTDDPPRAGKWAGAPGFYVIDLQDYTPLAPPLDLKAFVERNEEAVTEAAKGESAFPFAFRSDGIRAQLQYLTRAPQALLQILAQGMKEIEPIPDNTSPGDIEQLWLNGSEKPGLADILNEKLEAHARSTAYLARLAAWYNRHKGLIGDGDPTALVLAPGGYTGRIGSVKAHHGRLFWLIRDPEMNDVAARRAIEDAFRERPALRTVFCFRPDINAPGGLRVTDWGIRRPDPLVDRLQAEGVQFDLSPPFQAAPPPIQPVPPSPEPGISDLEEIDWSEVTLEAVMERAGIEGAEDAVLRALAALSSGMNVIFVGPPGTGKTTLATAICEAAGVGYDLRCASDHWTTFETIGGYFPEPDAAGQTRLRFRAGALLQSIQLGRCAIVDEINRADIDKAFGELFTLFGSKSAVELRLPLKIETEDHRQKDIVLSKSGTSVVAWPESDDIHRIEVPSSWRMIGSMNDADRASLKRLSLAFARRFAMVPVRLPGRDLYDSIVSSAATAEAERLSYSAAPNVERLVYLTRQLFVESEGLLAIGAALGPGFAITIIEQALSELAKSSTRTADKAFLSALELYVAPQFQGLATKHHDLVQLVRAHSKATEIELKEFEANLEAWTGGAVAF